MLGFCGRSPLDAHPGPLVGIGARQAPQQARRDGHAAGAGAEGSKASREARRRSAQAGARRQESAHAKEDAPRSAASVLE